MDRQKGQLLKSEATARLTFAAADSARVAEVLEELAGESAEPQSRVLAF